LHARAHVLDAGVQILGMAGLFQTIRRTLPWAWKLWRGKIEHSSLAPAAKLPMRAPDGSPASHALPGTPVAGTLMAIEAPKRQLLTIDGLPRSKAA
jgi:hypothetical protein